MCRRSQPRPAGRPRAPPCPNQKMVSEVSSDLSYLDDSDLDEEELPSSTRSERNARSARFRAGKGGQISGGEFRFQQWSFDTETLMSSADLILSGLHTGDILGKPRRLESWVGNGPPGLNSEQTRLYAGTSQMGDVADVADGGVSDADTDDKSSLSALTHAELVRLRQQLQQASLQQQTQLRQFVKDNFAETIETIDTVRDVVAGVRDVTGSGLGETRSRTGDGEGGKRTRVGETAVSMTSYEALASAIVELDEETEEAFRGYVERVELSENLNTVVQLFGAYDELIVLPGLLRGRVDEGDWEGFVRICEKAISEIRVVTRGLHVGNGTNRTCGANGGDGGSHRERPGSGGEVWVKLEEEVVKAAEQGVTELLKLLNGVRYGGERQWNAVGARGGPGDDGERLVHAFVQHGADAACYLERIKRLDGLSLGNLRDVDVLSAFVEGQVAGIMWLISQQLDARRSVDDVVTSVLKTSHLTMGWCQAYWDMCGRFEGMRRRGVTNAPFADMLLKVERCEETSTPRRVFSGYAELVKECVGRAFRLVLGADVVGGWSGPEPGAGDGRWVEGGFDASMGSAAMIPDASSLPSFMSPPSISSSRSSASQVMEGLMRISQESERVMATLSSVWSSWCVDEEGSKIHGIKAVAVKNERITCQSRRSGVLTLSRGLSTVTSPSTSSGSLDVSLTPQVRELFTHIIEHMLYTMEEYLRVRIAPSVFLLRGTMASHQRGIPRNQINSIHINPGFVPRSNMALLRASVDEVMGCTALLSKHARLIQAPIRYKANAFLKAVSAACSESIVSYVNNLPLASSSGDREAANHVNEFILLAACKTLDIVKTSVLPGLVTRHASVLQIGNATATENSNAFKWCCSQLEDGQELLMKLWVEIKLQRLEPVMNTVLDVSPVSQMADKTLEAELDSDNQHENSQLVDSGQGSKYQPKDAVHKLMSNLKEYDADISTMTPLLRDEVIGEMYLAVVEGFQNLVLSETFAGAAPEARLQTWVDAKAMETWMVAELGRDDADAVVMLRDVMQRVESDVHHAQGEASGELLELASQFSTKQ